MRKDFSTMKKITLLLLTLCSMCYLQARGLYNNTFVDDRLGYFNHLDIAVTAGTTGIGVEVASPIGKYVQVRTGFDYMPHINVNMDFGIQVVKASESSVTPAKSQERFTELRGILQSLMGVDIEDKITMKGQPRFNNFKLLFDVFPFENKKWRFTAGFYAGPSLIGKAENSMEDMATLMSVNFYNNIYENVLAGNPVVTIRDNSIYLPPSIEERITNTGQMSMHVGDFKDTGNQYRMVPNEKSMVTIKVKANRFKPYLGFGYGNSIVPKSKYSYSFDCGLLFWGGKPSVITHDGVDLVHDVTNLNGKVKRCVNMIKAVSAYPVINFRISRRIL